MRYILPATLLLATVSCKTANVSSSLREESATFSSAAPRPVHPQLCTAFRGNGNLIFGHWGAMARVLEDFGPVQGVAGGSSGAVTSFLYENMYRSAAAWKCDNESRACTQREAGNRMALMMKSLVPYLDVIKDLSGLQSEMAGRSRISIGLKLKKINQAISSADWDTAGQIILALIDKPEFSPIVNQKLLQDLKTGLASTNENIKGAAVMNMVGAAQALQWQIDDSSVFFRRGLIRMEQLGDKAGVVADFYAGIEGTSAKDLGLFLDRCAKDSVGKDWFDINTMKSGDATCGDLFNAAVGNHFKRVFEIVEQDDTRSIKVKYASKSIDEPVGKYLPVVAIDSFMADRASLAAFQAAHVQFLKTGAAPALNVDVSALRIGYMARQDDLNNVVTKAKTRSDQKSQMADSLGERTWRFILASSPLEPGLESAQCMVQDGTSKSPGEWRSMADVPDATQCIKLSTGGWIDLEPVNVLKDIGCEKVLMIHRAGGPTEFAEKMITFLSKTPDQAQNTLKRLYDLSAPNASSYAQSITTADGVVCTNWDHMTSSDQSTYLPCLVEHGYHSKILTSRPQSLAPLLQGAPRPASEVLDSTQLTFGCRVEAKPTDLPADATCNL